MFFWNLNMKYSIFENHPSSGCIEALDELFQHTYYQLYGIWTIGPVFTRKATIIIVIFLLLNLIYSILENEPSSGCIEALDELFQHTYKQI